MDLETMDQAADTGGPFVINRCLKARARVLTVSGNHMQLVLRETNHFKTSRSPSFR